MNYLGFRKEEVIPVGNQLNELLANYHIYYQNLRNFHWNIQGQNFFELHLQFEDLYNDAREKIDAIAERILTLRLQPYSRLSDYLKHTNIKESAILEDDVEMVSTILQNHKILIQNMRSLLHVAAKIKDEGTVDMIAGFMSNLEKKSWMLDAWATRVKANAIT